MKEEKWKAEDGGASSAAPEEWGSLYRQAFDGFPELHVPADMTDRIMNALDSELSPKLPEETAGEPAGKQMEANWAERLPSKIIGRGSVILADFGKYAASLAACLVLAFGVYAVNSPDGGLPADAGSIVTSEWPVKADTHLSRPDHGSRLPGLTKKNEEERDQNNSEAVQTPSEEPASTPAEGSEQSSEQEAVNTAPSPAAGASGSAGSQNTDRTAAQGNAAGESAPVQADASLTPETVSENSSDSNSTSSVSRSKSGGSGNEEPSSVNRESSSGGNSAGQEQTTSESMPGNTDNGIRESENVERENSTIADSSEDETVQQDEKSGSEERTPYRIFDSTHPVKELGSTEELPEYMGYAPPVVSELPEGWNISSIEVIWGITAQIVYYSEDDMVLYRTSAATTELSSDSGSYRFMKILDNYVLEGEDINNISLVTWTSGNQSFSMSFDRPVPEATALEWVSRVQ